MGGPGSGRRRRQVEEPCIIIDTDVGRLIVSVEMRAHMGLLPDAEIAQRCGVDRSAVTRARNALGIPADYGRKARQAREAEQCLEARQRFQRGERSPQISAEMNVPPRAVLRWIRGMSRATTWDQLVEVLTFLGPQTPRELAQVWVERPQRYLGLYVGDGWVVRQPDGRYALTGRGPKPGPLPEEKCTP